MNNPRVYGNSVVLPNGEVIVFGGIPLSTVFSDNGSILVPELWNPNTGNWTELADMETPRNYHSVGLLMKDGRIFLAGGGLCGGCSTNHADAEIFSPPYLFNSNGTLASRPQLTSVPSTANNNSSITVNTNSGVSSFALVRASAVTHSTNNEQRRIPLSFSAQGGNQYSLSIPNRNIIPPGNYMLFAMNSNGTPSIAEIINVGDDVNDCTPQTNPNLGGDGLSATYFNNMNLTNPVLERVDPTIDFEWFEGSPDPSVGANTFSVRWEGSIQVPRSGPYTFYTNSDDGVRLWVNNRLMVDNWTDHGPTEDIGMIILDEGQSYDIKMEYYENAVGATAQLSWSGPGILKQIIPSGNLFSNNPCSTGEPDVTNVSKTNSDCNQNNGSIAINFNDNPNRSSIEFSINGGSSWPAAYNVPDNSGSININNLAPGSYSLRARWGNDECPISLQTVTIDEVGCTGGGGCDDITYAGGNGTISIGGLDFAHINIQVYTSNWQPYYNCVDNCPNPFVLNNVPEGGYILLIKTFDQNWATECDLQVTVTVGSGGGCTDNDNDGVCQPDDCDDSNASIPAPVGSSCNDGNPDTNNDVIQSDGCTCAGTPVGCTDNDNDGVCQADDCDDSNASIPAPVGSSCNDGNPNTNNDVIQGDGCTCAGTPVGGGTCDDITYSGGSGTINIGGLDFPHINIQVYTSNWQPYYNCVDNCPSPFVLNNVPNGGYILLIKTFDQNWTTECDLQVTVTVGGGGGCTDNDNDGVCQPDDCDDSNASLPAPVGSSCNDGNPNTNNDEIQGDGCTCLGTPIGGGGCDAGISTTSNSITISNVDAPIFTLQVFTSTWQTVYTCFGDCVDPTNINNLAGGDYFVKINLYSAGWSEICEINETVTVGGSGNFQSTSPLEHLGLQASMVNGKVGLQWLTNLDYKTDHFVIEKSLNGLDFQTLKEMVSVSQTEEFIYYQNEDDDPVVGHNYYRIIQHFTDGTTKSSFVEIVYFELKPDITVYPNPNKGRLFVDVSNFRNMNLNVVVYGLDGEVYLDKNYDEHHSNTLELDMSKLMNGMYQVYVKPEGRKAVTKRVVLTRSY